MRCLKCGQKAWVEIPRHHCAYCDQCFPIFFENQVERAITKERMFTREERVLVAVSGGKDSLALWDALHRLGYQTTGLYIDLGIDEYSARSREKVEQFAAQRSLDYLVVSLEEEYEWNIGELNRLTHRKPCSACGLAKRYIFNLTAMAQKFPVIATGHNLDDEAATLFGNILHWQTGFIARQAPVLPANEAGLARKVKPLYRLTEKETASYAVLRGIDYIIEECPMARGTRSLIYKDLLNRMEQTSPGTKQSFYWGFLERARPLFQAAETAELRPCSRCGQATTEEVCAFCRLLDQARRRQETRTARQAVSPS